MTETVLRNLDAKHEQARRCHLVPLLRFILALGVLVSAHEGRAAPTCDSLALLGRADADSEASAWARATWASVVEAYSRLAAGAPPELVLLAPSDLAAGGWLCARANTVYLSHALLDYAWLGRASDGADLLAFTFAHELAHRRFDVADQGFTADACPVDDSPREVRADRRAVFLMAIARNPATGRGYSPFALARRDALATFFSAELGWSRECPALAARLSSVEGALRHVGDLGLVWDVALDLAYGAPETAIAFIDALQPETLGTSWDALPELDVLAALAHLDRAGEVGWCPADLARSGLEPDPCSLTCASIAPRYARLAPRDDEGARAGVAAKVELASARARLLRAGRNGVPASALAGPSACLAYLERRPDEALTALMSIERPTTARVRAALRDNARLFRLQRFLLHEATPIGSDDWLDALAELEAIQGVDASPAMSAIGAWLHPPEVPKLRLQPGSPPLATAPVSEVTVACPVEPTRSVVHAGVTLGLRGACTDVRIGGRTPFTVASPALPSAARELAFWRGACRLGAPGATDDGTTVVRATCATWDDEARWVLYIREHVVERAARINSIARIDPIDPIDPIGPIDRSP